MNNGLFLVSLYAHPEIKILIGLYWAFMSYLSYYLSQVSSNFDVISNPIFIWKWHNMVKYLLISDFFPKYKRYTFLMLSKLENISKYARIETLIWVSWKYGSFFVSHWNLAITWIEKHFWIGWKECQKKRKLEFCIGTIHVLRNHKTENPKLWLRNSWMVP